jgi:dihydroneopterin aldolase
MDTPVDSLKLELDRLPCRIGVLPGENAEPQPLSATVTLEFDLDEVLRSGRLADTVDYSGLHAELVRLVCGETWGLIEELGAALLAAALRPRRVLAATISVTKLEPPLGEGAGPVTLRFRRERGAA